MHKLTRFFPLCSFFFMCRLALYVYESLLHVGAQKSAQTFLSEVSHQRAARACVSTAKGHAVRPALTVLSQQVGSRREAF